MADELDEYVAGAMRDPAFRRAYEAAAPGWTVDEALEQFAAAGMPVDADRFRMAVTRVARIPRIGETPSGEKGGRGKLLYPIGELQRLHSALAPWLTVQDHGSET